MSPSSPALFKPCPRCSTAEVTSSGYCRPCGAAISKEWRQKNPQRVRELEQTPARKEYRRAWKIKTRYGITAEEYDAIVARGCAICGRRGDGIHMDHDHKTGRVRDALCRGCNSGLGSFQDNPERLRAAAEYLEDHA